jgi:beta-galactosidase
MYNNPEITQINRFEAHTRWGAYETFAQAAQANQAVSNNPAASTQAVSKWIKNLNGTYDFKLYNRPEQAEEFYLPGFDAAGFSQIRVPGNWETQGFGKPIYTNTDYPWEKDLDEPCVIRAEHGKEKVYNPPYIPSDNPTGCYRQTFDVPADYLTRDIFIRFEGVETAYKFWINGEFAGYSEDSKLPGEFNITKYLRAGENLLAVQVTRFATGFWLEDQDYWYLSGIYRNVSLIAKPRLRIADYQITALPNLHYGNGYFTADITVSRVEGFADCTVKAAILKDGAVIAGGEGKVASQAAYTTRYQPSANTARVSFEVPNAQLWTPETPALYTAVFTLLDKDGNETDFESCRVGFKKVEVENGVVLLNGRRLIVRGVNRHEHCPEGRTVTRQRMVEEIKQMKLMNINSVRTCHYPDTPDWYDLCDEYGILLVCECNLETHGVGGALSHNPSYAEQYLQRAVRMAQNYKNHACIYSWSLGNESGYGPGHAAMYGFIKEYDKTRLCQYEAGSPGANISDIRANMYEPIEGILKMLCDPTDSRPIILAEYLFQICNSGGGAYKFRQLVEDYPRFQGGYVWDWQDKSLNAYTKDGMHFFGYGGDFDEDYTDKYNPLFMMNCGIITADLKWKPVAHELRHVYAPVYVEAQYNPNPWFTTFKRDTVVIKNRSLAENTRDYLCTAFLKENGEVINTREVELPEIAPGGEGQINIGIPHEVKPGCEYYIDVALIRRGGGETYRAQFAQDCGKPVVPEESAHAVSITGGGETVSVIDGDDITVAAAGFTVTFEKSSALIKSLAQNGKTLIKNGAQPRFDRPRTGLDCQEGWIWHKETSLFDDAYTEVLSRAVTLSERRVVVTFELKTIPKNSTPVTGRLTYTVTGRGIKVDYFAAIPHVYELVSRVGLRFTLTEGFEELTYYGYGPGECYADRKDSACLGVYNSSVTNEHFAFNPPSENGGHEGTRYLILSDGNSALKFTGDSPFHFDARHNTTEDYRKAMHEHELIKRGDITLHIDAAHAPIGGNMSWSSGIERDNVPAAGGHFIGFMIEIAKTR